ncbi:ferrochelatase [Cognatiluteimonas telluris]|jgi:ferrochelatase|uniref:ferrochelatase n=1 Tax=Cognatiluteimonas telluris TaxID=1104775 RepID=UPI00140AE4F9|nr:ferrochelatase [Lysobacter telluris]
MPDSPTTAVLLVNLGTPAAPTPRAVRRYLGEFLGDPRVVQIPRWLWWPLLHGVILPLRGKRVAAKYAAIWLDRGSPLAVYTHDLAVALQARLPAMRVADAMRYGAPAIAATVAGLRADGATRVLVLPLYPQYSTTTTASVADALADCRDVDVRMVHDYHLDPRWVAAVAGSIRAHWQAHGRGAHLVLSLHGLPQRVVDGGDPYARQCEASACAIAAALGLDDGQWTLAYQSRFGRERWLQPSTLEVLDGLLARDVRRIDVACPGFAVDCLETLEEIAMQLAEHVAARGGELRAIPCLNASPAHADALAALLQLELEAWA